MFEVQMNNGDVFLTDTIVFGFDDIYIETLDEKMEAIVLWLKCADVMRAIVAGQKMTYDLKRD
jgi:hypothetical protein